jgi:hypothetical protein
MPDCITAAINKVRTTYFLCDCSRSGLEKLCGEREKVGIPVLDVHGSGIRPLC